MKLGLGTVQFGLPYGISNSYGKPSHEEVRAILALADQRQIKCLDTASLYGESEEVLGLCLPEKHRFEIVTKTPQFKTSSITEKECDQLVETFHRSLEKLRQKSVYALMIHHACDLLSVNGERLLSCLMDLKKQGLVRKIGVSVYNGLEIDRLLELGPFDLIQLPVNLLDQRLIESGHLRKLKQAGVEIHARSVFLQGLLLMPTESLSSTFASVKNHLEQIQAKLSLGGLSMLEASLGFVLGIPEVNHVLVGVSQERELIEILNVLDLIKSRSAEIGQIASTAAWNDERILNPALWGKYA